MLKQLKYWLIHPIAATPHGYPKSCLGGRMTLYSGKWADIRLRKGYLVVKWRRDSHYIFYSPNGTPSRAWWMLGKYND